MFHADRTRAPLDPPGARLVDALVAGGSLRRFDRNVEIYAQEDAVDRLYQVVKGMVLTSRGDIEGRRQICAFYGPGDLFGLEAGPRHEFAALGLTDCEVRCARRSDVRAAVGGLEFDSAVLAATRLELDRAQRHIRILGLKNAREKVYAFLQSLAGGARSELCGLPMGRQDIADYLGLTLETVSRMLTALQADDLVEFASHRAFRLRSHLPASRLAA